MHLWYTAQGFIICNKAQGCYYSLLFFNYVCIWVHCMDKLHPSYRAYLQDKILFSARKHYPGREADFANNFLLSSKPRSLYLSYQINCVWECLWVLRITGTGQHMSHSSKTGCLHGCCQGIGLGLLWLENHPQEFPEMGLLGMGQNLCGG